MTESEAKQKKCPLLFMFHVRSLQDDARPTVEYGCAGSACMMWRVSHTDEYFNGAKLQPGQRQYSTLPAEAITYVTHGYCGLAGKP